jgi:hypothetical protein
MSNGNRRDTCPRNIFSVSAHAKLSIILNTTITRRVINVKRYCFAIYPRSTPALFCAQSMCVTLGISAQVTR